MGADRQLATWDQVASYYQLIAKEDRRVRVETLGATTEGRPLLLVTVASLETLDRLDYYKDIQRRLADPRTTSPQQADTLISEGKTIVLITCSIHSNEVASTHTAIQFLYELLTKEDPRSQAILQNTIFLTL